MTSVPPDDRASAQRTWLVFALGPYLMCASALDVEGIIQCPEPIAKLPLTPDYALGAFLFRGRSAAAISLRRKLRLSQGEDLRTGPFIVTRIGEALVAFWVDEVKDVIEEKDAAWRPMPSMLDGGLFERFAIRENQLILQTSFAALREAQVEFESLAAWVAVQTDAKERRSESEPPQPAAPEGNEQQAAPRDSPSEAPSQAMLPTPVTAKPTSVTSKPTPVTPKLDLPTAGARRSPAATVAKVRVEGERLRYRSFRHPPVTPGTVVRTSEPVQIQVDPVNAHGSRSLDAAPPPLDAEPAPLAAVRAGSRRGRLAIAIGIGMSAIAAVVYQFLPAPVNDRHTRVSLAAPPLAQGSIATAATPVTQPSTKQVTNLEPDQITVTIERRREPAPLGKVVDAAAAQGLTTHVHTVVRGDTLWQIAKKQVGDPFRYPELAKLSDIRDPDLIRPGDVIRIEIRKQR